MPARASIHRGGQQERFKPTGHCDRRAGVSIGCKGSFRGSGQRRNMPEQDAECSVAAWGHGATEI
jgi:hypothetical protein